MQYVPANCSIALMPQVTETKNAPKGAFLLDSWRKRSLLALPNSFDQLCAVLTGVGTENGPIWLAKTEITNSDPTRESVKALLY